MDYGSPTTTARPQTTTTTMTTTEASKRNDDPALGARGGGAVNTLDADSNAVNGRAGKKRQRVEVAKGESGIQGDESERSSSADSRARTALPLVPGALVPVPIGKQESPERRRDPSTANLDLQNTLSTIVRQSDALSSEVGVLKQSFSAREEQLQRVFAGLETLSRVERELRELQTEYRECSRKDLALIQDALQRVANCLGQVEQLQRAGNATTLELQSLRSDCHRRIDTVLHRLKESSASTVTTASASTSNTNGRSTTVAARDAAVHSELRELRNEVAHCKTKLQELEPHRSESEGSMAQRISAYSTQLDHMRMQMFKMEQGLLQESELCRKSLEGQLARQIHQTRQIQEAENGQLREEMDELRSDMCDVLKEMHRLKERTKYLGPDGLYNRRGLYRSKNGSSRRGSGAGTRSNSTSEPHQSGCSGHHCGISPTMEERRLAEQHSLFCPFHHCPAGIPHGTRYSDDDGASSAATSSPRRPMEVSFVPPSSEPEAHCQVPPRDEPSRSCPSPHYSSRSSSVSGQISVTRDDAAHADEVVDPEELERRLLEQHRLFWISEGAGNSTYRQPVDTVASDLSRSPDRHPGSSRAS